MLEIICLGALVLATDICPDTGVNFTTPNAIELNITTTKAYFAARPYESDYSREAEKIRERQDTWNRRNSDSERNRYREYDRYDGGCVDENGRLQRNPDRECIEEQDIIYRDYERGDRERRDRIHRSPYYRR